jgi:hypothetical protein
MLNSQFSPDQFVAVCVLLALACGLGIKLGYKWGKNDWYSKGYVRGLSVGQSSRQVSK